MKRFLGTKLILILLVLLLPAGVSCKQTPTLYLSTTNLSFIATEYFENPPSQDIQIWTPEGSEISWQIDEDADWLEVTPSRGVSSGEKDNVTIAVDIEDMLYGSYNTVLSVQAREIDEPKYISVELVIEPNPKRSSTPTTPPPPPLGEISVSTTNLYFHATEYSENPPSQTIQISTPEGSGVSWQIAKDADWLEVIPDKGASLGEINIVTVTVNTTDMKVGRYIATITIRAFDIEEPQYIQVTLIIYTAP